MKITVIGAGNGGQAIAGYLSLNGHSICLYNRNLSKIQNIVKTKKIKLKGKINGVGKIEVITDNIKTAVDFSNIIFIATSADAHNEIARKIFPYLKENQIILLNPGRTGGVFEFQKIFSDLNNKKNIFLSEAQTLMFACRILHNGNVNIIGIKDKVLLSSDCINNTNYILQQISSLFPCFIPAKNLLHTSLENIGAIFHTCITIFNAAAIERGESFYFYRDITTQISNFILKIDEERLNIGKAYGLDLIPADNWVSYAYSNITGNNLLEKLKNNPAYHNILSPTSIYSRQLLEDIPTGLLPMSELGKLANVNVDLMSSIITICGSLLMINFLKTGRTLKSLGLDNLTLSELIKKYNY